MKINNKVVLFSLVLLCLAGMTAVEMRAQDSRYGGSPVYVYDRRDANGKGQGFDVGTYRNNRSEFGYNLKNDTASSVRVDRGYRVRVGCDLLNGWNGYGRFEDYSDATHNL